MAATGVIAKKMLRQSNACSSQPPTIGPSAIAAPVIAPHKPIASARSRRSVNTFEISDSVDGNTIAAPTPITERAAISAPALSVSPPAALARPKTDRPASSIPLRPNRSDRLPTASTDPANSRLNASTTHCNCELDACSSRTSVGSATLTIVVSRLMTNAANSSEIRISGLGLMALRETRDVLSAQSGSAAWPSRRPARERKQGLASRSEDVVEVGGVDRHVLDVDPGVVELAEHPAPRRDVAVGGEDVGGRPQRGGVSEPEIDVAVVDVALELLGRALRDQAGAVEDRDVVGELVGLLQVLGGEEHRRRVGDEAADDLPHRARTARIQAGGRLVEEDDPRRADQRRSPGRGGGAYRRSRWRPACRRHRRCRTARAARRSGGGRRLGRGAAGQPSAPGSR